MFVDTDQACFNAPLGTSVSADQHNVTIWSGLEIRRRCHRSGPSFVHGVKMPDRKIMLQLGSQMAQPQKILVAKPT